MIFSSVLLPLPFGPMIPKNSPVSTEKLMSVRACWRSNVLRSNGWRKCSFNVEVASCGNTNDFEIAETSTATDRAVAVGSARPARRTTATPA